MQQLDVTDDQLAYLERVRATLESEYLGPYGHVTTQDAVQYLIDVHEATAPEMPSVDVGVVEAAAPDEPREREGGVTTNGVEPATPEPGDESDGADEVDEADEGRGDEPNETNDEESDAEESETDSEGDADESPADGDETDGADTDDEDESSFDLDSGDNDRLQAMMNLLETHDDKWREGDGEARYEVDLPDGSTETVQTRDDVRAVLFKNYR